MLVEWSLFDPELPVTTVCYGGVQSRIDFRHPQVDFRRADALSGTNCTNMISRVASASKRCMVRRRA